MGQLVDDEKYPLLPLFFGRKAGENQKIQAYVIHTETLKFPEKREMPKLFQEYVNGIFKRGFCNLVSGGVGKGCWGGVGEGLEKGWGGVGEGLGRGLGRGGGRVGEAWLSALQKPHLKNPINVP